MATIPQLKKDFSKTLHSLSRTKNTSTVFSDWLEIAAICMHQLPFKSGDFSKDDADYQRLEAIYLDRIKGYDREEISQMAKMLALGMQMHRQEFGDHLGEIAGENELLNKRSGQFFTPFSISTVAAEVSLTNARELIEQQGIITISDPAVGGGAMLLAAANALVKQKIDPRSAAQFDAIDVSRNAFNMAYFQLAAADLQAMVRHGDSIAMQIWENRPTPQLRYFNRELQQAQAIARMKQLFTDPEGFFEGKAVEPVAQTVPEAVNVSDDQRLAPPVQQSLFGTEEFSGSDTTGSKKKRARADIVLPVGEQLGLFSKENEINK